jgi:hypothetical protein
VTHYLLRTHVVQQYSAAACRPLFLWCCKLPSNVAVPHADAVCPGLLPVTLLAFWLQLVDQVTACQERFDFNEAGQALYSWAWGEFADWCAPLNLL